MVFFNMKMDLCVIFIAAFCLIPSSAAPNKTSTLKQEGTKGDCDFEAGLCSYWSNIDTDEFDWQRRSGSTPSAATGPQRDHTTGRGYYLFIETSSPRKQGDEAKLVSKRMNGVYCLSFFYHMYGSSIGNFKVITNDGYVNKIVFDKTGNQENRWIGTNVTVYGLELRVIFSATTGKSYTGDIAIDDIRFFPGSCDGSVIDLKKLAKERKAEAKEMCVFDLGLCGWTQDSFEDNFDWVLARSTKKRGTGPTRDNTGNIISRYISMDSSKSSGFKARLLSGRICGEHCLRFAYHMLGRGVGDLKIYKQQGDTLDVIWKRSGNKGAKWHETLLDVHGIGCYKIVIEGVVGRGRFRGEGDIALDDLWLKKGNCCPLWSISYKNQENGNCDFDNGFCNWSNMRKANFNWKIGSSKSRRSSQTGPSAVSIGHKDGKYAYIDASEPRITGDKAVLISDQLRGSLCLHFKYHMYGEDVGSLEVHQNNDGLRKRLLWKQEGNFGNIWHQGFVNTTCNSITEAYEIEITATVGGWRGDIAIDDIYFTSTNCPSAQFPPKITNGKHVLPPSFKGYCGFGKSFCGWVNGFNNDYYWRLHKGATPSSETGPKSDYDNNDRFAYLEASNAVPNATAELVSGWIYGTRCLKFYYHMFGEGVGELRVKQIGVKRNGTQLWAKRGSQSAQWQIALVTLSGQEYKVAFVGIRGLDHRGDIALDGISLRDGDCLSTVLGLYPLNINWRPLMNCNFEKDFCRWQNQNSKQEKDTSEFTIRDDFDWTRHHAETFSVGTGPSSDHTTGLSGGHYIYIETSYPRKLNDKAILAMNVESKEENDDKCMTFYYHMWGSHIHSLTIEQDSPGIITTPMKLWSKVGNQGNEWKRAEVDIKGFPFYRIRIVGVRGKGYQGDIAIDDIKFIDAGCNYRK